MPVTMFQNLMPVVVVVLLLKSLVLIPETCSRGTRIRNQWLWPTYEEYLSTSPGPLDFPKYPSKKCVGKYDIEDDTRTEPKTQQQIRRTFRVLNPTMADLFLPSNLTFLLSEEYRKCFQVYETIGCNKDGAHLQFFNLTGPKKIFKLNIGGQKGEQERLLNFNIFPTSFEPCPAEDEAALMGTHCQSQFHLKIKTQINKKYDLTNDNCVNLDKPKKTSALTRTRAEVYIGRNNDRDHGTICLELYSQQNCNGDTTRLVVPHTSDLWRKYRGLNSIKIWDFYSDTNANPIVDTDINSVRKCSYCRTVLDAKDIPLVPYTAAPSQATHNNETTMPLLSMPKASASKADGTQQNQDYLHDSCISINEILNGHPYDAHAKPCYYYFNSSSCSTQPVIKETRMINKPLLKELVKKHSDFKNWAVVHCESITKHCKVPYCRIPVMNRSIPDALSMTEEKKGVVLEGNSVEKIVLCIAGALAFVMFVVVVIMSIMLWRKKRRIRAIRKRCIPKRLGNQQPQRQLNVHQGDQIEGNDYVNDITGLSALCHSFSGGEGDGESLEIPRNHIAIGSIRDCSSARIVGVGEFSIILKGKLEPSGRTVAVKSMKAGMATPKTMKYSLRECQVFMQVGKHPRILEFLGVCTESVRKGELLIVMEWCANGNLKGFLAQHKNHFENLVEHGEWGDEENMVKALKSNCSIKEGPPIKFNTLQLFKWCVQVADAMEFLAIRKIVHASLSARNVLLDDKFTCKISDFHFAKVLGDFSRNPANNVNRTNADKERLIPWRWFAVESLLDDVFSTQSDVWTYGVFMWEVFSLGVVAPFSDYTFGSEFTLCIKHGYRLQIPNFATVESYQLMLMCWYDAPDKRPSFTKLKMKLEEMIPTKMPIAPGPFQIIRSLSKNNSIDQNY